MVKGGFVGVDIFFVISGFLISSIILGGLQKNRFSFAEFYRRRIKRIFPALILVLSSCAAFGWFALLADEYTQLGRHTAAGAGFVSNFALWHDSGYFDAAADTKPLLHLWSLGIEEQFYIIWPLLLWVACKRRLNLLAVIATFSFVSFAVGIWMLGSDVVAKFYSPQARFWELLLGALLANAQLKDGAAFRRFRQLSPNTLALTGAALIGIAMFALDKHSAYPGWWALLPTVGAALILATGMHAWVSRAVLSNRVMVWFGLISYPLYLWHWPLLAFLRVTTDGEPAVWLRMGAVGAAVLLAWGTYRFVERPIRFGSGGHIQVAALTSGMACIFVVGILFNTEAIRPRNTREAVQQIVEASVDWETPKEFTSCATPEGSFLCSPGENSDITFFLGDSHLAQYSPRLVDVLRNKERQTNTIYLMWSGACPPIPSLEDPRPECNSVRNAAEAFIKSDKVKTVVVGCAWNGYLIKGRGEYYFNRDGEKLPYFEGRGRALALKELEQFLVRLSATKTVYLLLDNASDEVFNPKSYYEGTRFTGIHMQRVINPVSPPPPDELALNRELMALAARANVKVLNPIAALCPMQRCPVLDACGQFTYRDGGHLRPRFVREMASFVDAPVYSE